MAEIVAGFVGPAIQVVKWVGAPIRRQFSYLCCFTTNISSLVREAQKLDYDAAGLQVQVDRAIDDSRVIVPQVVIWLTEANAIKDQTAAILDQVSNVQSGCLKLRALFSLSKRAKKATDRIKELRREGMFDDISLPRPPAAREPLHLGKTYEFESRKHIEEDIISVLRDRDVSMIGICGTGGLGKTTVAKRIMNRVLEEHKFEEVVMAVFGLPVDKRKIQLEIGGSLGLKLEAETSEAVRRTKLYARLSGRKRILLLLDDVRERLKLEEFGIPCDSKGCTILFTSRNSDTLRAMDVEKMIEMEVLSKDEAWFLFREKAGTCVDDLQLKSIAQKIVKECYGLPGILATVGTALRDEKDPPIWRDALRQMRQSGPDAFPDFRSGVYYPIKLRYQNLSSEAKYLLLLCSLFPEGADIHVEHLTCFCMGLGIFEGIKNLKEARRKMSPMIKMLKIQSLLSDGSTEDEVRMHDIVHDVCINIAEQEGYIGGNDCMWILSSKIPDGLRYPNLRLLILSHNFQFEEEFELDSSSLEGIRDLSVLCFENYLLTSLPHTIKSLTKLKTLVLDHSCEKLKTISVVGELENLEILICRGCGSLEELPTEMKGLNSLKLFELTGCSGLQRIGRGIISSLVGLEELKMLESFKKWEAKDREGGNACLVELEALNNLRCLEIEIEDPTLAAEKMLLSSKMEAFDIRISAGFGAHHEGFNKKLSLLLVEETSRLGLGDWIKKQLLRDTEFLYLCGNGANSKDLAECQNMRWLDLGGCETMKNIVTSVNAAAFSSVKHLMLFSLPKLEEIWDAPIRSTSLQNLKELYLRDLVALQTWKSSQNQYAPLFPNLSSIQISGCPRLRILGQETIAYHNLKASYN